ncbi:MAG TPA: hypothetical protein VGP71_04105 [Burkholderiales bacterium]|jgi:hypothetical protein|nr:hypothetical protein [Burkholderiales bacterium]
MKAFVRYVALCCVLLAAPGALATCGSAFCTINTNWDAHGAWAEPGWRLDLRYERITQDQPQAGSDRISVGQLPRHHDEVFTKNRNWLATFDYTFNVDWAVSLALPYVDRSHFHIHNHHGQPLPESWDFSDAGDARVLGRYRLATFEDRDTPKLGTVGLSFGLKLPTGRTDVRNASGDLAERSLQPGTGTTDALLGAYYAQLLPMKDLSWFVQATAQVPVNSNDGFKPGRRLSIDAGLRYDAMESLSLMLQVNGLFRSRDSGVNAEPDDSGGTSWFLSPGFSVAITKDARLYAFHQIPIHQHVNGVQLTARSASLLGLSLRF